MRKASRPSQSYSPDISPTVSIAASRLWLRGYFVANAVKPLLAITTAWWHILLIRFSDRLAKGVRGAPRDVMVAESVGKERLGAAYGLIQSMDSAGAIAGPLMALVLLARFGIRSVFWAAAVPGALAVLVAIFGIRETKTQFEVCRTCGHREAQC